MPLPADSTLSLMGLPAEGDALYSRPKHAMIVRMSAETFDALDQLGDSKKLEMQFGDTPGFTIGDTFFPVKPTPENPQHHELYLRLPNMSKGKGLAPLKLHANVMQKLMVQRRLDEKVQETVRDRTLEAEKERKQPKVMYLDKPPDLSYSSSKTKKKDASARRPAVASSSYAMSPRPSALQPPSHPSSSRASPLHTPSHTTSSSRPVPSGSDRASSSKMSPLPASHPHTTGTPSDPKTRARLIHCLALKHPLTTDAVITMCAGKDPSPHMRNELLSLLQVVAERVHVARSDRDAPPRWQLKLDSWREVRPYEWSSYTDEERTQLARQARMAYQDLRIPKSDPVWDSARFRSSDEPAPGSSSKSTSSTRAPPEKNGVVMTKNTTKKPKATESRKKVSDIMIPAKDESNRGKARDLDEGSAAGTPTTATKPAPRRQPGSGYKAKQSVTPPVVDVRGISPLPPIPRKSGPVDARESKREPPAPSGSGKPQPPIPPPQTHDSRSSAGAAASSSMRRKVKDGQSTSSHRSDDRREDRRDERASERAREHEEKPRALKATAASPLPPPLPSFKRKKPAQDGNDSEFSEREVPLSASTSKKRKLEESHPGPAEKSRGRDLSLPKKPLVREPSPLAPSRTKVKQEASPLSLAFSPPHVRASLPPKPAPAERPHLTSSSSSPSVKNTKASQLSRSSSNKPRRKSPIYTSSEDESERSVAPSRSRAIQRAHSPSEDPPAKRFKATHTPRFKPGRPLPTDSAGLRKYYQTCWRVWNELYEDHDQRRKRIERMLKSSADRAEATDDDMDVDELSPDVVLGFMEDLTAVTNELHKVRKAYEQLGGKGDALGELVDVC